MISYGTRDKMTIDSPEFTTRDSEHDLSARVADVITGYNNFAFGDKDMFKRKFLSSSIDDMEVEKAFYRYLGIDQDTLEPSPMPIPVHKDEDITLYRSVTLLEDRSHLVIIQGYDGDAAPIIHS